MSKVKLCDICDFQGGSQPPKSQWITLQQDGYIRMLQIRDFTQPGKVKAEYVKLTNTTKWCLKDDILIARYGASLGKILTGLSGAYNVAMTKAVPNEAVISKKFLYYFLCSDTFQNCILNVGVRAAQAGFNKEDLSNIEIYCPDLSIQNKICKILELVDILINKSKLQMDELDLLVKSRFIEMFGDIVANDRHWNVMKLEQFSYSRLGKMLDSKKQNSQNQLFYLANTNVQWFTFNLKDLRKMSFNEAEQQEFELKEGDLLVCEGGEVGRCAVWHNDITNCFFQKALHRVRCNTNIMNPEYLSWWFKFQCDKDNFSAVIGSQATIAHLTGVKLKKLLVTVPPVNLQNQFADFLKQTDKSKFVVTAKFQ